MLGLASLFALLSRIFIPYFHSVAFAPCHSCLASFRCCALKLRHSLVAVLGEMRVLALRLSASAKSLFCVPHVGWPLSIAVISIDCAATSSFGGIQCTSRLLWLDPLHLRLSLFFCASRVLRFYEARVSPLLFNVSVRLILCSPWDRPSTNLSCDITSPSARSSVAIFHPPL